MAMNPTDQFPDAAADLQDAMPERWETAIEDLAQAIALGLDRAQDLADAVNDVFRTRPTLAKAAGAAVVGAIVGTIIATKTLHRRPKSKMDRVRQKADAISSSVVDQTSSAVDQAIAVARATADRMARRAPSREELVDGAARLRDSARSRATAAGDTNQMRYAAQLVPLGIALLKNPIVRDLIVRGALRATQRKK